MGTGPLQGTGNNRGSLVRFIIVGIINTLVGAGVMFFMYNIAGVFIAQYNYQKLQSEMENIASPKWRKLQRIF